MLQITIHDLLHRPWQEINPDCAPYCLYLVRHEDTVFYIGQSHNPLERLHAHMGLMQYEMSDLGACILGNVPDSHSWQVELYTLPELADAVTRNYGYQLPRYDIDIAEASMIRLHRPCFNVTYNRNPSPLPEAYAKYTEQRPNASSTQYLSV